MVASTECVMSFVPDVILSRATHYNDDLYDVVIAFRLIDHCFFIITHTKNYGRIFLKTSYSRIPTTLELSPLRYDSVPTHPTNERKRPVRVRDADVGVQIHEEAPVTATTPAGAAKANSFWLVLRWCINMMAVWY